MNTLSPKRYQAAAKAWASQHRGKAPATALSTGRFPVFETKPEVRDSEILDWDDVHFIVGRFGKLPDSREIEVHGPVLAEAMKHSQAKNEVWLRRTVYTEQPFTAAGGGHRPPRPEIQLWSADVLPAGTIAAWQANAEKAKTRKAKATAPRLFDLADTFPQLAGKPDRALAIGVVGDDFDPSRRSSGLATRAGREPVRGTDQILAWVTAQGGDLELYGDRLAIRSRFVLGPVREVVDAFERLLVAELRHSPLRCELPHLRNTPPAVTLLVGGAACCATHLEELAP